MRAEVSGCLTASYSRKASPALTDLVESPGLSSTPEAIEAIGPDRASPGAYCGASQPRFSAVSEITARTAPCEMP